MPRQAVAAAAADTYSTQSSCGVVQGNYLSIDRFQNNTIYSYW